MHIAKRLRALYINGDSGGAVEVILGAKSLDDLLDRLDMAQRVGGQDSKVLKDVRRFRNEVQTRRAKLRSDRSRQAQIVDERATRKRSIEGQLAERQRLLASVKDEIARMEAAERRRQAQLEAQARARLEAAAAARAVRATAGARGGLATRFLGVTPTRGTSSQRSARQVRRRRRDRDAVPRRAVRLGRREPVGIRLLRPHHVRLRADRHLASAQRGDAVQHRRRLRLARPAAAGDLVFFDGLGHMGMYIGGGQFIHAPHTGDVVKISSLNESWYASSYVGAKRVT